MVSRTVPLHVFASIDRLLAMYSLLDRTAIIEPSTDRNFQPEHLPYYHLGGCIIVVSLQRGQPSSSPPARLARRATVKPPSNNPCGPLSHRFILDAISRAIRSRSTSLPNLPPTP